jgi:hypothetical protein
MTTTTPHTLSLLANIGAAAAFFDPSLKGSWHLTVFSSSEYWEQEQPAREAFAKAVLDAVGYKFPVDPEREAFNAWYSSAQMASAGTSELAFQAWKTGREELRKVYEAKSQSALDEIIPQTAKQPENDGWIDWPGGMFSPVDRNVTVQVQYRANDFGDTGNAGFFRWNHSDKASDIIAYKIVKP